MHDVIVKRDIKSMAKHEKSHIIEKKPTIEKFTNSKNLKIKAKYIARTSKYDYKIINEKSQW